MSFTWNMIQSGGQGMSLPERLLWVFLDIVYDLATAIYWVTIYSFVYLVLLLAFVFVAAHAAYSGLHWRRLVAFDRGLR